MSTRKRGNKDEWRRFKHFQTENEKLRKEVSKLRKLVNSSVVDQLEEKAKRVDKGEPAIIKEAVCERCGNPTLDILSIKRADGNFKIEVCRSCQHRTTLKPI